MAGLYSEEAGFFRRLAKDAGPAWPAYVDHEFVRGIGDGTLPETCFRRYLVQDYLFLIHFARAHALAAYKSTSLEDIRQASAGVSAIVDIEMGLHVEFCRGWGLTEAEMAAAPEAPETMAYTRYVLEAGLSGDLLDLHVALAPCIVGYGEIGRMLTRQPLPNDNPYRPWIEMYAGDEYQEAAAGAVAFLDKLAAERGGDARFPALSGVFERATRLEIAFWDMGMAAADGDA